MRKSLFLLIVSIIIFSNHTVVQGQEKIVKQGQNEKKFLAAWPQNCRSLKHEWASQSRQNLLYTQPTQNPPHSPLWILQVNGITIPIPAIAYNQVNVFRDDLTGLPSMFLNKSGKGGFVGILRSETDSTPQGWDLSGLLPTTAPPSQEWLKQELGNPISVEALFALSLQHRPQELSCSINRWQIEIPISLSLQTKKNFPLEKLLAVYPGKTEKVSWIASGQGSTYMEWRAAETYPKHQSRITIRVPRSSAFTDIGSGIGRTDLQSSSGRPAWLDLLQVALDKDQPAEWQALANALAVAGMSKEDVGKARAMAKAP
jgi:hypothetical protein